MLDLLALTEPGYAAGYLIGAGRAAAERPVPTHGPTFSILLPTHAPPRGYLARAVHSVLRQSYGNWQLVLADDASPGADTAAWLGALAAQDDRVELHLSPRHGHISRTTNLALAHARGDYVTFLDQDDELAPYALAEIVRALAARPDAQLLYSDEDRVDPFGTRFLPYFKPRWSPDLLLSQNYICHLAVYPRALLAALGGLRPGYEGSQDHDLALRASAQLRPEQIVHVPQVLYHWRTLERSTATYGAAAKPYALDAGRRALADHIRTVQPDAEVQAARGFYAVRWPPPRRATRVRVVLHGLDAASADAAVLAWRSATPADVGGAPVEWRTVCTDHLRYDACARPGPDDFADRVAAWQNAAEDKQTPAPDVLVLVRADLRPRDAGWLDVLLRQVLRPEVGCVGGKVVSEDGNIEQLGLVVDPSWGPAPSHAGCPAGADGYFGRAALVHNVGAVGRDLLGLRHELWQRAGGLRPAATPALADVDLARRVAKLGVRHLVEPELTVTAPASTHPLGAALGQGSNVVADHPSTSAGPEGLDPCYSPHLTCRPSSHAYRQHGG